MPIRFGLEASMIGLFPHCGFLSETSRMLAFHDALRALGEPVCIASHGGPWEYLLGQAGVAWVKLDPHMDRERCARFIQNLPGIARRTRASTPTPRCWPMRAPRRTSCANAACALPSRASR
jgi:hypothetical protein